MEITVADQLIIFLYAVLCGIALGVLFDLFRIVRRLTKPSVIATGFQDILYWVIAGCVVFWYLFTYNNGDLRLFEFLGIIIAGLIYNFTLSKVVIKAGVASCTVIGKGIMFVLKILLMPIAFIFKIIRRPLLVAVNATGRGRRKYRRVKKGILHKTKVSIKNFGRIFKKF